ncbi:hypothetical protein BRD17_07500 [Halobacteriales archaeon SW_7_68_16]|nr:MAG: hypothetical protein BRD17_07500 [Halobacteriales archaeon SW_7_68_16]
MSDGSFDAGVTTIDDLEEQSGRVVGDRLERLDLPLASKHGSRTAVDAWMRSVRDELDRW